MEIRDFVEVNSKITLKKALAIYDFFKDTKTVCYSENHTEEVEVSSHYHECDRHISVYFDLYDWNIAVGFWTGKNSLQLCVTTDMLENGNRNFNYETDNLKAFKNKFWDIIECIQDIDFCGF